MNSEKKKLYMSLLKVGCIGFGGGSALIPVLHREIVEDKKLVTEEDFNKDVLVAVATPGALPVEVSVGIGSKVCSMAGFVFAPIMVSIPGTLLSLVIIILLGQVSTALKKQFTLVSLSITAYIVSEIIFYVYKTVRDMICNRHDLMISTNGVKQAGFTFKADTAELIYRILISVAIIALFSCVILFIVPDAISFTWRACLSSILSFGGGDAYIALAEAMFVSTGLIVSELFYSIIVPTVNTTPGSILCKTLACVGYCIGLSESGSAAVGLVLALCGYMFSISMSCITYALGSYFLEAITTLKIWDYVRIFLRLIIAVLQINVLWKLINSFLKNGSVFGQGTVFNIILLVILVGANLLIPRIFKVKKWYVILVSLAVCIVLGNISY